MLVAGIEPATLAFRVYINNCISTMIYQLIYTSFEGVPRPPIHSKSRRF